MRIYRVCFRFLLLLLVVGCWFFVTSFSNSIQLSLCHSLVRSVRWRAFPHPSSSPRFSRLRRDHHPSPRVERGRGRGNFAHHAATHRKSSPLFLTGQFFHHWYCPTV